MQTFTKYLWIIPLVLFGLMVGCTDNPTTPEEEPDDFSTVPEPYDTTEVTPTVTSEGLRIFELEEGSGRYKVVENDVVWVNYTLRDSAGNVLDSSYKNGSTDSVRFSLPGTIDGFRQGLLDMKEGGKRSLVVPPELGYTENSANPAYQGMTLYFDVELELIYLN
ncbi:MAG: FKBP-type peptidyl-prolyl cis-trans isomerase [Bacteroidota bacterium]